MVLLCYILALTSLNSAFSLSMSVCCAGHSMPSPSVWFGLGICLMSAPSQRGCHQKIRQGKSYHVEMHLNQTHQYQPMRFCYIPCNVNGLDVRDPPPDAPTSRCSAVCCSSPRSLLWRSSSPLAAIYVSDQRNTSANHIPSTTHPMSHSSTFPFPWVQVSVPVLPSTSHPVYPSASHRGTLGSRAISFPINQISRPAFSLQ